MARLGALPAASMGSATAAAPAANYRCWLGGRNCEFPESAAGSAVLGLRRVTAAAADRLVLARLSFQSPLAERASQGERSARGGWSTAPSPTKASALTAAWAIRRERREPHWAARGKRALRAWQAWASHPNRARRPEPEAEHKCRPAGPVADTGGRTGSRRHWRTSHLDCSWVPAAIARCRSCRAASPSSASRSLDRRSQSAGNSSWACEPTSCDIEPAGPEPPRWALAADRTRRRRSARQASPLHNSVRGRPSPEPSSRAGGHRRQGRGFRS